MEISEKGLVEIQWNKEKILIKKNILFLKK
jgi:hypothetical protein